MKLFVFSLLLFFQFFCINAVFSQITNSQKPVYLTFTTHNEDGEPYNNFIYYKTKRNFIVQLADSIIKRGVKWSFQSDWKFLQAVKNFDTGSVVLNTNGKNLIKWLTEDRGIKCDPHSHEANGYNYADVAYLHSQLGITPSKVVGGFLYNVVIGGNNWENLENGIYGRTYTSYFWKPDILWGAGTQSHINDPQKYGVWKPKSMIDFYSHDSSKNLMLIGNGCSNKIYDTSNITNNVQKFRNIINAISLGVFPDSGFFTASIHSQIGDFSLPQINRIIQFIDSVQIYADQGKIVWKDLQEIQNIWENENNKIPFGTSCSDIPSVYSYFNIKLIQEGFYDKADDKLSLKDTVRAYLRNNTTPFAIIDSAKALVDSLSFTGNFIFFKADSGMYYIDIKHRNCLETFSKSGGEFFIKGGIMNYDFTINQDQAFGNNLKQKGTRFCIISGDCNSDGIIDLSDMTLIFNDSQMFKNGYNNSDIDGNCITDLNDLIISFNNSVDFAEVISP